MKKTRADYFYVSGQLILFAAFILDPNWVQLSIPLLVQWLGWGFVFIGGGVILLAMAQLNTNLTPYPSPKQSATLIQSGLYRYMRHPIYSGILMAFFGLALTNGSIVQAIIVIALYILFYYKSSYEEQRLLETFSEYEAYRQRTGRFFPSLF